MVDEHPQPSAPTAGLADAFVSAAVELAQAVRELASAIRDTAAFADVEMVPCDGGDCADDDPDASTDCDRTRPRDSVVLPLVPAQDRTEQVSGPLCQPGGCSCNEPGVGRHARRDDHAPEVSTGRTAGCCQDVSAGAQ